MEYPVFRNRSIIGNAQIERNGLYANIHCQCQNSAGDFCKLTMTFSDKVLDLGHWVRNGAFFVVHKKIPIKHLGEGEPTFCAVSEARVQETVSHPILPDKPFPYLEMLPEGSLQFKDGKVHFCCQSNVSDGSASSQ